MFKEDVGEILNGHRIDEAKKYLHQAVLLLRDTENYNEVVDIINEAIRRMDDND